MKSYRHVDFFLALALSATASACSTPNGGVRKDANTAAKALETAPLAAPSFLAHFDKTKGEVPEGLWRTSNGYALTFAPQGKVVAFADDGQVKALGVLPSAKDILSLSVVTDAHENLYFGVAALGANPGTAPGVYQLPAGGGTPRLFSAATAVSPAMSFANGLAFVQDNLFVADSEGIVYRVDPTGRATVWNDDASLKPDKTACAGRTPLPIGANGIAQGGRGIYVMNTDFGRILEIPIRSDGSSGTVRIVKEDCPLLAGADGITVDSRDRTLLVAVNPQNKIVHVTPDGQAQVIAEGAPLDGPASPVIEDRGGSRRVVVTNSSFFTPDNAMAGIVSVPLP